MEFWNEIWITLRRNTWRSIMTMFGVLWGIWMLIVLCAIGKGVGNAILPNSDKVPANMAFFWAMPTTLPYHGFQTGRWWSFNMDDIEAIKHFLGKKAKHVGANVWGGNDTYNNGAQHASYRSQGVMPCQQIVSNIEMIHGRFINDIDISQRRKVCVIGEEVYKALFPNGANPCGTRLQTQSLHYTVVGVMRQVSHITIGSNARNTIFIPITTVQQVKHLGNDVGSYYVIFDDKYEAGDYQERIATKLKERHHVSPDDKAAIYIFNLKEELSSFKALFFGIEALMWIVGLGALLSGLIGISNIMLVTVKERTQEIGIRRAIGAKPRVIISQIMCEALALTTVAGITGLVAGCWTVAGIAMATEGQDISDGTLITNPQVPFALAVGALFIIIIGGLLAGLMPAARAMKIKAIDAIREE